MAVRGSRQSVPADDHHPGHRSPMGVRLAVDGISQHFRLRDEQDVIRRVV